MPLHSLLEHSTFWLCCELRGKEVPPRDRLPGPRRCALCLWTSVPWSSAREVRRRCYPPVLAPVPPPPLPCHIWGTTTVVLLPPCYFNMLGNPYEVCSRVNISSSEVGKLKASWRLRTRSAGGCPCALPWKPPVWEPWPMGVSEGRDRALSRVRTGGRNVKVGWRKSEPEGRWVASGG